LEPSNAVSTTLLIIVIIPILFMMERSFLSLSFSALADMTSKQRHNTPSVIHLFHPHNPQTTNQTPLLQNHILLIHILCNQSSLAPFVSSFLRSNSSIASFIAIGGALEPYRLCGLPSWSMRNFPKFQRTSLVLSLWGSACLRKEKTSLVLAPLTSPFSNQVNLLEPWNFSSTNVRISSWVPGS